MHKNNLFLILTPEVASCTNLKKNKNKYFPLKKIEKTYSFSNATKSSSSKTSVTKACKEKYIKLKSLLKRVALLVQQLKSKIVDQGIVT